MGILRDDEVLPRIRRQPGDYLSQEVTLPAAATHLTAIADSRGLWDPRAAQETVLSLTIEAFLDNAWVVLGGFTTDASTIQGKDGLVLDASSVRVRLPRARTGQPPVRTVLQCASACTGRVRLVFDDTPLPVRPAAEHQSVTYDTDNEAVGSGANSVTIGSFAVGNNANRCMVVGVAAWSETAGDTVVSTISHNSSTAGWASVINDLGPGAGTNRCSIWRKVAPAVVSSTVVVTMVGTCAELGANALSVWDVNQTTPIGTAASAEGFGDDPLTATVNVTAATGDLVYDVVDAYSQSGEVVGTVGALQTQRANTVLVDYGSVRTMMFVSTEPGAATTTMSWSLTNGTDSQFLTVACPIKMVAAVVPPRPRMLTQAVHRAAIH